MPVFRDGKKITVVIDSLAGGLANSVFAGGENQFAPGSRCLDFETEQGTIRPQLALSGDISGDLQTFAAKFIIRSSNNNILTGVTDLTPNISLGTVSLGSTSSYSAVDVDAGDTDGPQKGTVVIEWKSYLWFYTGVAVLTKYGDITSSPTITLNVGSVDSGNVGLDIIATKSFLYYCSGESIGRASDASTFNATALTLDSSQQVRSLTRWQNYIVAGVSMAFDSDYSSLVIWDGVSTQMARQPVIIPDSGLRVVRNLGETVFAFCISADSNSSLGAKNKLKIYAWSGGPVEKVAELDLENTTLGTFTVYPGAVDVHENKIYFSIGAPTANTMTRDNGIYSLNKNGVLNLEYVPTSNSSDTLDLDYYFTKWIDNRLVTLHLNGANTVFAQSTAGSLVYSSNAILDTLAYRFSPTKKSRITRVRFGMKKMPASVSLQLLEKVDQASSFTAVKTFSTDDDTEGLVEGGTEYVFPTGNTHQLEFKFTSSSASKVDIILPIVIEAEEMDDYT